MKVAVHDVWAAIFI